MLNLIVLNELTTSDPKNHLLSPNQLIIQNLQFALISMECRILGIFACKAVKEKFRCHSDAMTKTCMLKSLKGHIQYLAQHLQPAKCIAKEQNVIMKPNPQESMDQPYGSNTYGSVGQK